MERLQSYLPDLGTAQRVRACGPGCAPHQHKRQQQQAAGVRRHAKTNSKFGVASGAAPLTSQSLTSEKRGPENGFLEVGAQNAQ